MSNEVDFWDVEKYAEELRYASLDEAVECWWDQLATCSDEPQETTLTVYQWRRMKPDRRSLNPLEHCLEALDEEYGHPNVYETQSPTTFEAMQAAENVFVDAVLAHYEPWSCEQIGSTLVRVRYTNDGFEIIDGDAETGGKD